MEVLTYVPSSVILLISGYQVKGWNSFEITRSTPQFRQVRGIRGKNTRTRIKDSSCTLRVAVLQTELVNEVFSKCLEADMSTGNIRLELTLRDLNGTSLFTSTTAYIVGYPTVTYNKEVAEVVWEFACEESYMYQGAARNRAAEVISSGIQRLGEVVGGIL